MGITFHDPSEALLPPNETRILSLSAEPWPDGRRVSVEVQVTAFQQRPNLHISIYDARSQKVASLGAMQIRQTQIGFTVHLRHPDTTGRYRMSAYLAYADPDLGIVDEVQTTLEIP